jgi:hypothetical protein
MAEPERTDQEIDDAIRQWQLRLRDVPDALGVSRERVQERWEWFRREVYRWIAEGRSTAEIVAEVGLPTSAIAAFRARWTHGYRPEGLVGPEPPPEPDDAPGGEEIEEAVVTTFGLERDLQRTLRETIAQLKPDLKIIDEGREHRSAAGQIDILCDGGDGALMVVDLEAGVAKDAALGQDQARDDGGWSLRRSAGPRRHGRQGLQQADASRLLRAPQPPAGELRHPLHLPGPQLRLAWEHPTGFTVR